MRKIVILLFGIFSFVIFANEVDAGVCDNDDIKRLKELANIIDVSYEYIDNDLSDNSEDDSWGIVNSYYVTVSNLTQELYIKKGATEYRYSDIVDGNLRFTTNSGRIQLFVYTDRCKDILLRTIDLDLPKFNVYSYRQECTDLKDLNLDFCDEWYQGYLDDRIFAKFIEPYLNDNNEFEVTVVDKIVRFLKKYYIYIGLGFMVIVGAVVVVVRHRKRSVLE